MNIFIAKEVFITNEWVAIVDVLIFRERF